MRRVAAGLALWLALLVVVSTQQAFADDRTCELHADTGELRCVLVAQPAPPLTVSLSKDLPLVWKREPLNQWESVARSHGCTRTVNDLTEIGVGYVVTLINTSTLEQLYLDYVCTWPGDPPPDPPPPPPTPAELAASNAQAMTLQPVLSPPVSIGGLTGLASWLWCTDPGPIGTGVTLRGWTATGQVRIVQLGWEVGGRAGVVRTSTSCGSQEAPSVTWTPESIGDYSIALTSVWAGDWDLTWNGIPMGTFPLGPISLTAQPQPYPVDEYRGELTG